MQFGLATVVLTAVAPLGGALSFRKFGLLHRLPDRLQAPTKWAHRTVCFVPPAWEGGGGSLPICSTPIPSLPLVLRMRGERLNGSAAG